MLKTNSKSAREHIKNYIIQNFDGTNYSPLYDGIEGDFERIREAIKECFTNEKLKYDKRKMTRFEVFEDWAQGLPSIIDTCYYYNRSAVKDLAEILEESEAEAGRFTESEAERKLTYLIYREMYA